LAKRERPGLFSARFRKSGRDAGLAAGAGVLLAVLGAAGTGSLPFPDRVLFWTPLMVALTALGWSVALVATQVIRIRSSTAAFLAVTLCVTLISSLVVLLWSGLFFRDGSPAISRLGEIFPPALGITVAMSALIFHLERPGQHTHAAPGSVMRCRFLERLPLPYSRAVLIAVRSEDHYVRAYTSAGDTLILMRLSDAVAELEGLEGAQVHRSWWVSRAAVDAWRREGGQRFLLLRGGLMVPVSRPNVRPLEDAGWFVSAPEP